MVPSPLGKSGVAGKGLMSISVKKDTKFPNASIALAQFFTNPRSMVQFAKQVAVYPSSPSAYDDPFFSTPPTADRGQRAAARQGASSRPTQDIVPTVPNKADVNDIVLQGRRVGALQQRRRPGGARQGRRRREQAPEVGLTGSAARSPGAQPIAGPSHPGRASVVNAPSTDSDGHLTQERP